MSKTIDKAVDRSESCHSWWKDSDGYWIVLAPGLKCAFSDCHTIHEWNVKDCLLAIRNVQECDCAECREGL